MYRTLPTLLLALSTFFFSLASASASHPHVQPLLSPLHDTHPSPDAALFPAPAPELPKNNKNSTTGTKNLLSPRQATPGRCGADYANQICTNNQCCSSYGYCGTEFEFCGEIVGCQPQFGRCGDGGSTTTLTSATSTSTSTFTSTSVSTSTLTLTSTSTASSTTASTSSTPLPTLTPSINGQCGNSTTCAGSAFGSCCSEYFFCGEGLAYCGEGCRYIYIYIVHDCSSDLGLVYDFVYNYVVNCSPHTNKRQYER
ncbi:Chitin binding protein [Pyrenophora teres f. maculata]|nr:Chitin binding protein [Pyrenophora teres f. maculata]